MYIVRTGTCQADCVINLAAKLRSVDSGDSAVFAVLYEDNGEDATLVVIGGVAVSEEDNSGMIDGSISSYASGGFFVPPQGANDTVNIVVFDEKYMIVGNSPVTSATTYSWNSRGEMSFMMYSKSGNTFHGDGPVTLSATVLDEEPDAVYDYVIGMDPQVANYWPPVPPKSASLVVNGVEMDNKALFPDNPTVSFGKRTIHWFEDEQGRKPWPEDLVDRDTSIDPALDKTEVMHWVRCFQGATGPVTSIQPKEGSPIKVYGYGTFDRANTGDLEIDAEFDIGIDGGNVPGYLVPKRSRNGRLLAGPVVERIVGGPGVSIISSAGEGQGTVSIALDDGSYMSQFSDIALENAEQAKIGMFPYIRLKGYSGNSISRPSAFTATMRVPTNLPDGEYAMKIMASVFGENGFDNVNAQKYARVSLSYNILPDFSASGDMMYGNLKTSLLKPNSDRYVDIPFGHVYGSSGNIKYNGFDPVYITNGSTRDDKDDILLHAIGSVIPSADEFAGKELGDSIYLRPGYLVGIRISRAVTSGYVPYDAPIGFMYLSWELVSAE